MSDIKLEKSIINAWDWDRMLGLYFPQWFHEFADEALESSDVSFGCNSATVFSGPQAFVILESAYFSMMESNFSSEQCDEIKNIIYKVRDEFNLNRHDSYFMVWS